SLASSFNVKFFDKRIFFNKAPISTGPIMIHPPMLELIIATIIPKLKSHKTQLARPKRLE
ncbi:MAG: hypothetical protein E6455_03290, partial [Streptococcus salivarius]|nr:hypothetical protein [Streptococcus salivarius]